MRALVAILLLIGLSFVAIMTYGLARDPDPVPAAPSSDCTSPPPMEDGEVDEDAAEDWCRDPPDIVAGMTRRFGPKTIFLSQPVSAPVNGLDVNVSAPAAPPDEQEEPEGRMRLAPFEWRSGGPMLIRHDNQKLCLCRPGAPLDADDMEDCGEGWVRNRRVAGGGLQCGPNDGKGAIVLNAGGGRIGFQAPASPSTVAQPEP